MVNLLKSKNSIIVQTAAFALCNLARSDHPNLEEFFNLDIIKITVQLLTTATLEELTNYLLDVLWLLTYLTVTEDEHKIQLWINAGLLPILSRFMVETAVFVNEHKDQNIEKSVVIPTARILGNIACCANESYISELLIDQRILPAILQYLRSEVRVIAKEICWVVSNIAANPKAVGPLVNAGFIPVLSDLVYHSLFETKKEAAYALSNIAKDNAYIELLLDSNCLPRFLALIATPDYALVMLILSFVGLVLEKSPRGKKMFLEASGIEKLETLQFNLDTSLYKLASSIIDAHFTEVDEEMENGDN